MTGVIDIASVDDHPIVRDSVASWVGAVENNTGENNTGRDNTGGSGIRVVGTAATVAALLAGPGRHAHVVLLDLDLGDGTTVEENVAAIGAAGPAVLVLSASERPPAVRAAITEVAAGRDWISPRLAYILATDDAPDRPALSEQERRALQLYATGMPMKSVARRMAISDDTAKQYLQRVRLKYQRAGRSAPTKLELYHRAVEDGHIPPSP